MIIKIKISGINNAPLNGILFNVLKSLKLLYSTFETISMAAVIKKSEMTMRAVKSLNE